MKSRWTKPGLVVAALLIGALQYVQQREKLREAAPTAATASPTQPSGNAASDIALAFSERRSDVQVQAEGVVTRVLADDDKGSRHQRFLLRLPSAQTVLIAHNIDLAARVDGLRQGDVVSFAGEYEWNERGGVVHWTHRDPAGRHVAGWLRHDGRLYQ